MASVVSSLCEIFYFRLQILDFKFWILDFRSQYFSLLRFTDQAQNIRPGGEFDQHVEVVSHKRDKFYSQLVDQIISRINTSARTWFSVVQRTISG